MQPLRIAVASNAAWNLVNFRAGLIQSLQDRGYEVVAIAPEDGSAARLAEMNVPLYPVPIDSKGLSPAHDLLLLMRYVRLLRRHQPAVLLAWTAKPNVYASLAAHMLGIKVINNVSGLGTAFIHEGVITRVVTELYRLAFRRSATVFFQNPEDLHLFVQKGIVSAAKAALLPGSGIDLAHFSPRPKTGAGSPFTFLMIARLLWDKGVREYVEAARLVRREVADVHFELLGFLDVENRTAVPRQDVESWVAEGLIEYLEPCEDVRPFLAAADCVVLPSYREGLPRVLLEASAMGRPVITTNVPGCRHVVKDGVTGFLCTVRDPRALADAMLRMLRLDPSARDQLGAAGHARAVAQFDERLVAELYLRAIGESGHRG